MHGPRIRSLQRKVRSEILSPPEVARWPRHRYDQRAVKSIPRQDFLGAPALSPTVMLTRRRAGEIAEEYLSRIGALSRDEVLRRWGLPEAGGTGPEVSEIRDEVSGAFYLQTVTASVSPDNKVVLVVVIIPPQPGYDHVGRWVVRWLPRALAVTLRGGPRWLWPVHRHLVLADEGVEAGC